MKKKTAFWSILLLTIVCIAVLIYAQVNSAVKREFPIDGSNVADLDTERVVDMIAEAKKLDDGLQLCVNGDNFDIMFTLDFKWANDGVPEDYERVLIYSQNGAANNNGWNIHLEIQPLHVVPEGGYNGSGDEVLQVFYNHKD